MSDAIDQACVNTLRFLAVDAVEAAKSGHPGLPMGAAPMAYAVWQRHLRFVPSDPRSADRDRFVLSAGHGSALLYALLHAYGYDLSLDELKRFRQLKSLTPGHPESHVTGGVEMTTGPLGQGLASAVGLAIAEAHLAARYQAAGKPLFDHFTYVLASDGDLMEGVTAEAGALAGHLGLGKLIVLWDDNRITLAASTDLAFTENVPARYEAYGWQVLHVEQGDDVDAIDAAILEAKAETGKPTLIRVRTTIGHGAPNVQGTPKAHGSPLGGDEAKAAKKALGWPLEPTFHVPAEARARFAEAHARGAAHAKAFDARLAALKSEKPEVAAEVTRRLAGELPANWETTLPTFAADPKGIATRRAGRDVIRAVGKALPELVGGSADLDPSCETALVGEGDFQRPGEAPSGTHGRAGGAWGPAGRNVHFGVREHAMGSIANGLVWHGGFRSFTATFLVFADYLRPAIRLAALSNLGTIFVFTHDSVAVGEDGPTHQPIEQVASMRSIPNLLVLRPADANETRVAWEIAIESRHRPSVLVLTRQGVPTLDRSAGLGAAEEAKRGAYVLAREKGARADVVLVATGSEVSLALSAREQLAGKGVDARVVSMPCWRLFEEQPQDYRDAVLPPDVRARVAVEAGSTFGWERWVGDAGVIVALDRFGESAPGEQVLATLGFTVEGVVAAAETSRAKASRAR